MEANSTKDLLIFLGIGIFAMIPFAHLGYLIWFQPIRFKVLVQKRIAGNQGLLTSGILARWMNTTGYLWFVRIMILIVLGFFMFVTSATVFELYNRIV